MLYVDLLLRISFFFHSGLDFITFLFFDIVALCILIVLKKKKLLQLHGHLQRILVMLYVLFSSCCDAGHTENIFEQNIN